MFIWGGLGVIPLQEISANLANYDYKFVNKVDVILLKYMYNYAFDWLWLTWNWPGTIISQVVYLLPYKGHMRAVA